MKNFTRSSNSLSRFTLASSNSIFSNLLSPRIESSTLRSLPSSQNNFSSRPVWLSWFYNMPIGRRQLLSLIVCELIPILGFGIGSTLILTRSLQTQLLAQAKSELAVLETNYNIKMDQMEFGSRGQSDNPAIITAARRNQQGENLPVSLQGQVKQILQNETKAQKIEVATLASKNSRILVSANANRSEEPIANSNLVKLIEQSVREVRQVKANEIISWNELRKEEAPLPEGLNQQDALIRYVVTPVKDPDTQEVVGVLIFGDVVNRKLAIVEQTLEAVNDGYSAIYFRQRDGEYALATSLTKSDPSQPPKVDVTLSDPAIVKAAADAKGETVTQRTQVGEKIYTVAAKAVPNQIVEIPEGSVPTITDHPPAILVRGTPEDHLNNLLSSSLWQQAIVLLISIAVIVACSLLFRRMVVRPIRELKQVTQNFAEGDRTSRANVYSQDEIGQLASTFNQMANSIVVSETALANEARRQAQQAREAGALSEITMRMRRSLNSDNILQTAIEEILNFFQVDRVIVYRLNDGSLEGTVTAESVTNDNLSVLSRSVRDYLGLGQLEQYTTQTVWSINSINAADVNDRYRRNLAELDVKAEIVTPLKRNNRLVGLLCAQECFRPRQWQESEMNLLVQLAIQIGYALDQSQMFQERQDALQNSETLKGSFQEQIIQLLEEVQGASRGDLTVRASVASGDLETVADFFNTVIESLRQIVVRIQASATQVGQLLSENEQVVSQLSAEARQQAQEATRTLNSLQLMVQAIQTVAEQARQAAAIAQDTSTAAQTGESVMDSTVDSIYSLRATIEDATRKVRDLGESSQQIGRIVSLINDLAVQTDLLAINASIEASRAGDQGRGFGLIASEIGELAARSTDATREITAMIEAIQQQTAEVVRVMNQGATQVVEGAHMARNAKQSLVHVVHVSRQVDEFARSISDTIAAQMQTAQSIATLVQRMVQASDHTADSSDQVSSVLRQTMNTAEELQAAVGMLRVNQVSRDPG